MKRSAVGCLCSNDSQWLIAYHEAIVDSCHAVHSPNDFLRHLLLKERFDVAFQDDGFAIAGSDLDGAIADVGA